MIIIDRCPAIICNDYKDADETVSEIIEVPVWNASFHILDTIIIIILNELVVLIET